MSNENLEKVKLFHVATGSPVLPRPGIPPYDRIRLRAKLVIEEALEVVGALLGHDESQTRALVALNCQAIDMELDPRPDLKKVAKELADLEYVTLGTALEMGLPSQEIFDATHENNLTEVSGPRRADGKIGKPDGYLPVDLGPILDACA
jgi:predicted HAD superfamily Cof-like phosphohydrolase